MVGEGTAVDIGDISAEHERRALSATAALNQACLTNRQLNGIRGCLDQGVDRVSEVFDARQKCRLAKEAMIDRDVKASLGIGVEQSVQAGGDI
jgi:hypothetical protein